MIYSHEVQQMCCVKKGANHESAPIPEEGKWVVAKEIKDISGLTHGVGWCAPQQGACKLTLNVKDGIIQEALVETIGCSGMTHSAAMASEILPGKTILEALNTDLVCDAINTAMRELFKQIVYGRTQSAFSEGGLVIGASLEDLGKGLRSQVGHDVRHAGQGHALPRNGRRLLHPHGARRERRGDRLRVRASGQVHGFREEGHRSQGGARKRPRAATVVSPRPRSTSIRVTNKPLFNRIIRN